MRESAAVLNGSDEMLTRSRGAPTARVELLDGSLVDIDLDRKARGSELLDKVCLYLDLTEKDYFGLQHEQRGDPRVWLDLNRRLSKTFKNDPWEVRLAVKFHPPEPSDLQDDMTRYQLKLAIRRDILEGRLACSTVTHALLASYLLQSELGDYEESASCAVGNLASYELTPASVLNHELEEKIIELYKKHEGQTPAEAELNYLENAKKLAMYGVDLHPAKDLEGVDIHVGVCSSGVSVYRDTLLMNRFPWTKVLKISYKKRVFTLRLRAGDCDEFEIQLSFRLSCARAAKKLWRAAVERHIFYRRTAPVEVPRMASFPRLGSRRTCCRSTLHQLRCTPAHHVAAGSQRHISRALLVR